MTDPLAVVARKVAEQRRRDYDRDQEMRQVEGVRSGDIQNVLPGMFPPTWPRPIIANFLDTSAQDVGESVGTMPTISCASSVTASDRARKYASKRTKIALNYAELSQLALKLPMAADWLATYGFLPLLVEPHFADRMPVIRFEHPMGCYYGMDHLGNVTWFAKVHQAEAGELVDKFPHLRQLILADVGNTSMVSSAMVEMVEYHDADQKIIYLPTRGDQVVKQRPNPMGELTVTVVERPRWDGRRTRGQFDDVAWVQVARHKFALMAMEGAEKSLYAPIILPSDVQRLPIGPDAYIRTATPQGVGKMPIKLDPVAFQTQEYLESEMRVGARYPEGRMGKTSASVITGQGIDALNGAFDTQVQKYQLYMGWGIRKSLSFCFEMDQKFWPRARKQIRVQVKGDQFDETYVPRDDIAGNFHVDVTYGMAAAMDPNRAMVFLLQGLGAKLFSRGFTLEQLPFDIDSTQEGQRLDAEELDDALKQGLFGLAGNFGAMAAQGQDPSDILTKMAQVRDKRVKGMALHEAILDAFKPPPQPPGSSPPEAPPGAPTQGPGAQGAGGPPPGVPQPAPGGQAPGGADIMQLLAGLTGGGGPNLQANVRRTAPAG